MANGLWQNDFVEPLNSGLRGNHKPYVHGGAILPGVWVFLPYSLNARWHLVQELIRNIINAMAKKSPKSRRRRSPLSRGIRRLGVAAMVVILLGVVLAERLNIWSPAPGTDQSRYHERTFRVVRVIDGDTLDIDCPDGSKRHTRIRLWGVDTPETRHPTLGQRYYGLEASAFAKEQAEGKRVQVWLEPFEDSRDKYGRLLAYVFLPDGMMLNEELIGQGYGYADERFDHVYQDKFLRRQKEAHWQKRGLWQEVRPDQWPQWYRRRHDPAYRSELAPDAAGSSAQGN